MSARPPLIPMATYALVTQASHGFALKDVVRYDGSAYVKALADSEQDAEVSGMVSKVISADRFYLTSHGKVNLLSGLTPGTTYFLSETTPGLLTTAETSTVDHVSKPLFIATSTTEGYFFDWRGMTIPPGAGGGPVTVSQLNVGTDFRIVPITGGAKLEVRNPGTNLWAIADQWTNP